MKVKNILIVNNDVGFIEALRARLNQTGFRGEGVSQGAQLFQALTKIQPDLIILDEDLDSPSWTDMVKRLRQASSTRGGVYILTVKEITPVLKQQAKIHFIKELVKKPLVMSEFLETLNNLLGK